MRGGRVVHLRISPKDCMRVVDVLGKMGIDARTFNGSLSFSHAVKKALESCLYSLERDKIIPERDGFEYSEMMLPFPEKEAALKARSDQIKYTDLESHPSHVADPIVPDDYDKAARRRKYTELITKYQAAPESFDDSQMQELAPLIDEFQ